MTFIHGVQAGNCVPEAVSEGEKRKEGENK
jgi:hypothetical protein